MGDASRVYLVMQYYDATGTLLGSDTYEPSAMQVERADDGSMLVTFEMPQMPQEGLLLHERHGPDDLRRGLWRIHDF